MSATANGTEVKRGRGRPLGSKNAPKTETEETARNILAGVNAFAVSMYRDAFAKVIRAEDKARVEDVEVARARDDIEIALKAEEARIAARLAQIAEERKNIYALALAKAQGAAKSKAEFAESGRAELGNIAVALRLTVEQVAEIERLYLETRKDSAPTSAAEQPAA